jgi:hypothetical protein
LIYQMQIERVEPGGPNQPFPIENAKPPLFDGHQAGLLECAKRTVDVNDTDAHGIGQLLLRQRE